MGHYKLHLEKRQIIFHFLTESTASVMVSLPIMQSSFKIVRWDSKLDSFSFFNISLSFIVSFRWWLLAASNTTLESRLDSNAVQTNHNHSVEMGNKSWTSPLSVFRTDSRQLVITWTEFFFLIDSLLRLCFYGNWNKDKATQSCSTDCRADSNVTFWNLVLPE